MNASLKQKCELLADNYTVIHKDFVLEFEIMEMVAASSYMYAGMKADTEKMKECRKILAGKQGMFSELRSTVELALLSKMAVDNNPEAYLDEVIGVYEKVKKGKIFSSPYMVLSAMIIVDQHKVGQADEVIKKLNSIMNKMEKEHPILTGKEDMPLATIMALSPIDADKLIDEMEACFDILKKKFVFHKDAVQGLCQVLCISGSGSEDKCKKAADIFDALKKKGIKYGKSIELAALGALVDIDMDADAIATEIDECSDLLKKHKGFGNLSLGKEYRAMFSALLVAEEYAPRAAGIQNATIGSSIAVTIAEEVVMAIILATCTTASAAAATTASSN
ncbi:MAG: DUF4003 family protein [Lachnospiraceae bacterium]|nr:DUF4003 family protein [Lachnospiraceae bacterium]